MGDSASKIRKAAEASAKQGQKEEGAKIQLLEEMGHRLIKQFQEHARLEKNDPFEFAMGKIITERSAIQLLSSQNTDDLKKSVVKIVRDFAEGEIADGICDIARKGIDALMASTVGSVSETQQYTVKLNAISVQRVDFYMYQYDFAAAGLIKDYSRLFVYAYTISTIQNVTPNLLRSVIF